jgi:hypothetical protein
VGDFLVSDGVFHEGEAAQLGEERQVAQGPDCAVVQGELRQFGEFPETLPHFLGDFVEGAVTEVQTGELTRHLLEVIAHPLELADEFAPQRAIRLHQAVNAFESGSDDLRAASYIIKLYPAQSVS